jgi:Co/Zn/Cd efflux system component
VADLHVMADLVQSVAVFVGGVFIWMKPEWYMIDPILTLGFCILVLDNTLGVFRSSIQGAVGRDSTECRLAKGV